MGQLISFSPVGSVPFPPVFIYTGREKRENGNSDNSRNREKREGGKTGTFIFLLERTRRKESSEEELVPAKRDKRHE